MGSNLKNEPVGYNGLGCVIAVQHAHTFDIFGLRKEKVHYTTLIYRRDLGFDLQPQN
jgi:hypothetical protein